MRRDQVRSNPIYVYVSREGVIFGESERQFVERIDSMPAGSDTLNRERGPLGTLELGMNGDAAISLSSARIPRSELRLGPDGEPIDESFRPDWSPEETGVSLFAHIPEKAVDVQIFIVTSRAPSELKLLPGGDRYADWMLGQSGEEGNQSGILRNMDTKLVLGRLGLAVVQAITTSDEDIVQSSGARRKAPESLSESVTREIVDDKADNATQAVSNVSSSGQVPTFLKWIAIAVLSAGLPILIARVNSRAR